jgi:hypothetical protein
MADSEYKAEAPVPIWTEISGISALDRMVQRPVLVEAEVLGKAMRGQVLQMNMSGANVLPDESVLFWKNVPVKISFRYADIVYVLSGMTLASKVGLSFRLEFDSVTQKRFVILGKNLGDAGLLDVADAELMYAAKEMQADAPEAQECKQRIHHRYDIVVGSKLAIINSDCVLDSKILDLSLGGCRLYTNAPNNIQLGTLVEVQFVECGLPLRLAAKVQVKHGEHILGLMYLNISCRLKEWLDRLICEIAERSEDLVPDPRL